MATKGFESLKVNNENARQISRVWRNYYYRTHFGNNLFMKILIFLDTCEPATPGSLDCVVLRALMRWFWARLNETVLVAVDYLRETTVQKP